MDREEIGRRIREARWKMGLTQGQLGHLVGVKKSAVCQWEAGKHLPRADVLLQVYKLLGIEIRNQINEGG